MCIDCDNMGGVDNCFQNQPTFFEFRKKFLIDSIQDLFLLFEITTSEFYDTVHSCEYEEESMLNQFTHNYAIYSRFEESDKSYKRAKRLMPFLLSGRPPQYPEISGDESQKIFFGRKIYDAELERAMRDTYNQAAQILGYRPLEKTVPDFDRYPDFSFELWKKNSKKMYINAGYFIPIKCLDLERNNFNYIEYIFFSCLYASVRSQSIRVLNQPVDTKDKRRNARRRFKDFYKKLQDLRKEFIFVFLNRIIDSPNKSVQHAMDTDGCITLSEVKDYERWCKWFRYVCPIAECVANGYLVPNLDVDNLKMVDCKKLLLDAPCFPSVYKEYLRKKESLLSDVPLSIYKDACCLADVVNNVIQLAIENAPELFRAFQESSIIPKGMRVYDYMKDLS